MAAADQARRRVERDLHDGAQQRLVSLALRSRVSQGRVPPKAGGLAAQLDALVTEAAVSAVNEPRELARGIHPMLLAEGGLAPVREAPVRRSAVPVELDLTVGGGCPSGSRSRRTTWCPRHLTNVAKRAEASFVQVRVDIVEAGGAGLPPVEVRDVVARGSGLLGRKDRKALGGRILLHRLPGSGTTVRLELPLTASNGGATFL